jgi:isorenieratene synthase
MGIFSGKFSVLDTYFLLSHYQDEFIRFRERTGGEVIELHSYLASNELAASTPEVARALVERELVRAWPELAGQIVHFEQADNGRTFDKQGVGHRQFQPGMRTAVPNLVLCGSWIKTTDAVHDMEKAVVTGLQAANAVLEARGLSPYTVLAPRPPSLLQRISSRLGRWLPTPPAVMGHRRDLTRQ